VLAEMLELEKSDDGILLLRATVYCFLAERFDFHTNEFWPIAFSSVEGEGRTKKKLKDEEEEEYEGKEEEEAN
jgi:hypothetical protein